MTNLSTSKFNDGPRVSGIMNLAGLFCLALFFALSSCNSGSKQADETEDATTDRQEQETEERTAKATMEPASGSNVTGEVTFTERESGKVRIDS